MRRNPLLLLSITALLAITGCGQDEDESETGPKYAANAERLNESGCWIDNLDDNSMDLICGERSITIEGDFRPEVNNYDFTLDGENSTNVTSSQAVTEALVVNVGDDESEPVYEVRVFHNMNGAGCLTAQNAHGEVVHDTCDYTDDVTVTASKNIAP